MNHALQHKKHNNRATTSSKPVSIKHANSIKAVLQPKLKIGPPNDKYEQEADRVADQVMRMPTPTQFSPINSSPTSNINNIQRKCAGCAKEDELIQKKASATTPDVTPTINSSIQSLQSGGQPLGQSERKFFEPRFGADFSHVRLHTDNQAANTAKSINARAFTYGNNIVLGAGEYSSGSIGRKLMAHELTHVIQQNATQLSLKPLTSQLPTISKTGDAIQRRTLGIAGASWFQNCQNQLQNFFMIPEDGPPGFHPTGSGSSFRVDDIDGFWFKYHTPKSEWFKIPDIGTAHVSCNDDERNPSIGPAAVIPFATAGWSSDDIHTPNPF